MRALFIIPAGFLFISLFLFSCGTDTPVTNSGVPNNADPTVSSQSVSLTFDGKSTGSPAFTFGFLSYNGGNYSGSGITGTVSLYETVGGKIKGSFSGTFSDGTTTNQGSGKFTVYRTQ